MSCSQISSSSTPCISPGKPRKSTRSLASPTKVWYRALAAAGTEADVRTVEVDRDAIVLGLAVGGRAEGARPARRQQLYQVFTVADSKIIDIRGYPDRHSALTRDTAR